MLTLHRDPSYADALRYYEVIVDGITVEKVKKGGTCSFSSLRPGNHTIWVKVDWCRSNKIAFNYTGEPLNFECGSNLKGFRLMLAVIYLFMPTRWCWIRQTSA
jgi:hypothetical protein